MTFVIIFLCLFISYYLFQKSKIRRIEKQEYIQERKNQKLNELLDLARKQDEQNSEKGKANENDN
ncbi:MULTISPECIES: hypothetical protein [Chryseobacterium]|uniref:Uncharacterized protein n=1 Tax=Chryseobacterium taihuense TaxID=1141221 RepID=A0A4U8WG18_9FLAO|nr:MULTISPECIES: hypothetical protein [Chryseobacterium]QQV02795.1 hypothetical protein I6I61_00055 [Chryseobacterium sp. FDAARGOS 1104]VFB03935.1 Uncharacterised protein [Chryseobacterium taihuense]